MSIEKATRSTTNCSDGKVEPDVSVGPPLHGVFPTRKENPHQHMSDGPSAKPCLQQSLEAANTFSLPATASIHFTRELSWMDVSSIRHGL